MTFVLLALIGYSVGSIPSAYLTMRVYTGKDIRRLGTGNATATAVALHANWRPAAVAIIAEFAKAAVLILIARLWVGEAWAGLVILTAGVLGSSWSIWLKGGGGQGQSMMGIGLLLLSPIAMLIAGAFYLLPMALTRRHNLSDYVFRFAIPVVLWLWNGSWEWGLAGVLLVAPPVIKQWRYGDDLLEARKAREIGHGGVGAGAV
jgi:glycerol-3-phosphate acyltransferase PlsY